MATAAAHPGALPHATATSSPTSQVVIPLSNVEAQWEKLTSDEQLTVQQQLEDLQKKDWKTLSIDEKKAGAYLRFVWPFASFMCLGPAFFLTIKLPVSLSI